MKRTDTPNTAPLADRRSFLKLAGAGVVGAGAAATTGSAVEAAEAKPERGGGYRESEHVKRYYALAREY